MHHLDRVAIWQVLLLLALATQGVGWFPGEVESFAGVVLLPLAGARLLFGAAARSRVKTALAGMAIFAAIGVWLASPPLRIASIGGLVLLRPLCGAKRADPTTSLLIRAAALVALWWTAYTSIPGFYQEIQIFSREYTHFLAAIVGRDLALGATAASIHNLVILLCGALLLAPMLAKGKRRFVLTAVPIILAAHWLYLALAGVIATYLMWPLTGHLAAVLQLPWILLLLVLAISWRGLGRLRLRDSASSSMSRRGVLATLVLLVVAAAVASYPVSDASQGLSGKVVLYDKGYLSWQLPTFSSFGRDSGGMFGLLPDFLRAKGLNPTIASEIDSAALDDVSIVVFINLNEAMSDEEHAQIWEFIEDGGSLLVLGDHTGLAGIRDPFNRLLEPVGIEFNSDSADPIGRTWRDGLRWFPSRLTMGLSRTEDVPIGVGASLEVPVSADIVFAGVGAFADAGDETNEDKGYIGDFSYKAGEPLGDLSLIAKIRHGKGRVLVFGDTSPFQNGSLGAGELMLDNCLRWLMGDTQAEDACRLRSQLAAGVVLLAALAGLSLGAGGFTWLPVAMLPWLVLAPWSAGQVLPTTFPDDWIPAALDLGHAQPVDKMWWEERSIGGLQLNLLRNHVWVLPTNELAKTLDRAKLAILLPATRDYSESELERLVQFTEGGGVILATVGFDAQDRNRALLETFGFALGATPLGPAVCEAFDENFRFWCAYPIKKHPDGFHVIAAAYDQPVGGWVKRGKGAFLLLADSGFLINPNLESGSQYVPQNVAFLRNLMGFLRQEELQ